MPEIPLEGKAPEIFQCRFENDCKKQISNTYKAWYRSADRQRGSHVHVDGREMIMMASNDYLGLGTHPKVIKAAQNAIAQWGLSTTGARLANGSRSYHASLEEKLAAFLGKEACMVSAAGYLSCMSAPATFALHGDLIAADRNVHSSLWSGILQSTARFERFAHNDAADLERILAAAPEEQAKITIIEGVYSMEGHIAPLPEIAAVARGHNALLIMDDAHGFGTLGRQGRGTADHFGLTDEVDILCGSLSKSLSSTGGFVAGSRAAIEYLQANSKQTIFSAALSPTQAVGAEAALDVMQQEPEHLERLWQNTRLYKALLDRIGVNYWGSTTPAVPLMIGNRERAYNIWKSLWEDGIYTVLAIAPAVPPGCDLIRTAVSARHSTEDIERAGEAIARACTRFPA